ncbi:LOW QUALITY PROTEIN: DNA-directed RNA polymerase I subunit RPA1 [Colletotrichum tofieldiae]|nr:LOW QUALITY PROTEIN: DNA-directed RNA polymerase I subunit RPA1 [Colletotrichum tofieldiae]
MNISQPISSSIETVEFTFLTDEEIKAISVKRIENDSTFDNLLNPCATCNLNQSSCPGHAGHIELPVPVYHPVFLDQVLRLLRSQCVYCKGFRMRHREINRYSCKLRLLQHGLLHEAHLVDAIGEELKGLALPGVPTDYESEAEEEGTSSVDNVISAREAYVRQALKSHKLSLGEVRKGKHEGAIEMRRELIKDFMTQITKPRRCDNCGGISPAYRKDRFVKIFEKALSERDLAQMAQRNLHLKDSMATAARARKSKSKRGAADADEGVADVDMASVEENDVEMRDASDDDQALADKEDDSAADAIAVAPGQQRYISAMEVRARLRELFEKEQDIMSLVYNSKPMTKKAAKVSADMFFIRTILVPPNKFRPEARTGDSQISEAQQNSLYKMIMRNCGNIARIHQSVGAMDQYGRPRDITDLHQVWTELQESVNSLIDKSKNPVQGAAAKRNEDGIKQKLEKKEGLFRKNMMGKRVNFAARSVISPDPNIETNEIGVPPVFARKLTYPEPVTSHNFRDMQQAVINGVDKWPGAAAIEYENGQIVNLRSKSVDDRVSLANQLLAPTNNQMSGMKGKKVYRHLTNGDVVLMNRQPTLHKPSIMGHRVRVLPGEKTIRMHYANCNTYNADFDGDEMNMHFPQNEVARAEALQIADTDHQYLSGTAGKPLRGLIQDHLSVSVALCNKDTFFDRDSYQQLIYSALRPESGHILGERIELLPRRWTGKQVISTILKNIKPPNGEGLWMTGKCQVKAEQWGKSHAEEGNVLFQDGQFLTGILDKAHLGPSSGGLIHSIHEIYGPAVAGKLLSGMGRLLTRYLNMRAFTCGMDDLRLTSEGEHVRREALKAAKNIGLEVAAKYVSLEDKAPNSTDPELLIRLEEVMRDDTKQEGLDMLMNQSSGKVSSAVTTACLPIGLVKQFPKNQMQSMTTSGAKGSQVNANLISCNLGQQVLEGRRVPLMVSGKSLPCFKPFETDVRAGGYIVQRFLTGIRPRNTISITWLVGLIDTAVKTSRSGYLQRCIIKGMEGLTVTYDSTVRDADGTLVQFLYGEDGLDPTKQKYLTDFSFVLRNVGSESAQLNFSNGFKEKLAGSKDKILKHMKSAIKHAKLNSTAAKDPIISMVNPARVAFATSEKFYEQMTKYIKDNKDGLIRDKSGAPSGLTNAPPKKSAELVFAAKYMRSLVEAGEGVGIVAGQSVGEPSTQMTLNTFHLAGHSAKNVTLGIPRLREILMTASRSISTPAMTLLLHEELSAAEGERPALADVLDTATVNERIGKGNNGALAKLYDVRLNFFPAKEYTKAYAIDTTDVMDTVEKRFLDHLLKIMADKDGSDDEEDGDGETDSDEGVLRAERVKDRYLRVTKFRNDEAGEWCEFTLEFEANTPKVLMLNIVQAAVKKSVVQQIPGVGSCTFTADHKIKDSAGNDVSVPAIYTSGCNLKAMQKYGDFINPNKIATNDIGAVLEVYGVEACRHNIVSELAGVFGGHGISVDNRHLNLIADYMTRNGDYTPFNRNGLRGNPFTKMSFETTLAFLKDAVLDGDWDDLRTPSGRIVMGRLGKIGTGAFDVLTALPTHHMSSNVE